MIIKPKIRGFICATSHPDGCRQNVMEQIKYIKKKAPISDGPKKVLIIGASTGYGLASRITAAFGYQAKTIGVFFEKEASGQRTASAGWYNSAAFEEAAIEEGLYAKSINGDAFSNEIKQQTVDLIKNDWDGEVDLVVYSLASPRRVHPETGEDLRSVLKTLGNTYTNKTVNISSGEVSEITVEPANEEEIRQTEAVMGGEDWAMWIDALSKAGLLADQVKTVAYTYIGPELTYPVYREGTIGKAKLHLEKTAQEIDAKLQRKGGHAYISVNKALVTQASAAIPVVPLYISLLYKVMKAKSLHEGCIEQIQRLYADFLYSTNELLTDKNGLIRLDDKEMRVDVQETVADLWKKVNTENLSDISDISGYRHEFSKLFGFEVDGVDYSKETNITVSIPSQRQ